VDGRDKPGHDECGESTQRAAGISHQCGLGLLEKANGCGIMPGRPRYFAELSGGA
jgi:hypothetical protein